MKYNRTDVIWWLFSTSFKLNLGIHSPLYITFTIFYYNTISLKTVYIYSCSKLKAFIKQNHKLVRIFLFFFNKGPTINLKEGGGGGGVMVFCLVQNFFSDNTRVRWFFFSRQARNFFQNLTLDYMTKTLNQIIFFFLHQNQNIFFSNIGNQNIFLEKTMTPPSS